MNSAARNIREMALNSDTSTYDNYEKKVEEQLAEVDTELKTLKKTGVVSDSLYQEYSKSLSDWGKIGYSIMEEIKNGNMDNAKDAILNKCTPALDQTVEVGQKLDKATDAARSRAIVSMIVLVVAAILIIVVCVIVAVFLARAISARVLKSILDPCNVFSAKTFQSKE